MDTPDTPEQSGRVIAIECNGARAAIWMSTADLFGPIVAESLPLGWSPATPRPGDRRFGLAIDDTGYVVSDGDTATHHDQLEVAIHALRSELFMHVLSTPRDLVFLHAGCVAHGGGAILLPGPAGIGKTTLVAALVRAGAVYYTDDYAPVDASGHVHPYPLSLWLAEPGAGIGRPVEPQQLGAVGSEPLPVTVIARIAFTKGGAWDVRQCSGSEGVMLLLSNSLGAGDRPEFALGALRHAAADALVLAGERGDPHEAAAQLLEIAASRTPA